MTRLETSLTIAKPQDYESSLVSLILYASQEAKTVISTFGNEKNTHSGVTLIGI